MRINKRPDQDQGSVLDMVVTGHTQTLDVCITEYTLVHLFTWRSVHVIYLCAWSVEILV